MQFEDECRKQSQAVAEADRNDPDLLVFLDAALADLLIYEDERDAQPAGKNGH